jgi:hypothetical protein
MPMTRKERREHRKTLRCCGVCAKWRELGPEYHTLITYGDCSNPASDHNGTHVAFVDTCPNRIPETPWDRVKKYLSIARKRRKHERMLRKLRLDHWGH